MMPHQQLLDLLARYQPLDASERKHRRLIGDFVRKTPNCLERSCLAGHITASAWLIHPKQKSFLLVHHKKLSQWLQPGGHVDGNPDILDSAVREAREESGLADIVPLSQDIFDIDIHPISAYKNEPAHFHYDLRFLLQARKAGPLHTNSESNSIRWVSSAALPWLTQEESVLRLARKYQSRDLTHKNARV